MDRDKQPRQLHRTVRSDRGQKYRGPSCGAAYAPYDHCCDIYPSVPRVTRPAQGVERIAVWWAGTGSVLTMLFEQAALALVREMPVNVGSRSQCGAETTANAQITLDCFDIVPTFTRAVDSVRKAKNLVTPLPKHPRWVVFKRGKADRMTASQFKAMADKKKNLTDKDIEAIVEDKLFKVPETYAWETFQVQTGNQFTSTATVTLKHQHDNITEAACGEGPVDAIYQTINRIVGQPIQLIDYGIKSVTSGTDALGEVTVELESEGIKATGRGLSGDTLEASGMAYVNAVNKIVYKRSEESHGYDNGRKDIG